MIRVVRHTHRYDGIPDPSLTPEGQQQAAALKGHYDLVICSPLRRTLQTLHCSRVTYRRLMVSELCREQRDHNICN